MTYFDKSTESSTGHGTGLLVERELRYRLLKRGPGRLRALSASWLSPEERGRMTRANKAKQKGDRHLRADRLRRKRTKKHGFYGRSRNLKGPGWLGRKTR